MIELVFITSNSAKLNHAQHVCRDYAVKIVKQKNYGVGYTEPRIVERDNLLKLSIEDAITRFEKTSSNASNKCFFIEDTSVIIRCLSQETEVPGVEVKYWLEGKSFDIIDKLLKENGNDRSVNVRSDIVLALSKELQIKYNCKYKIFTSSIDGSISDSDFKIETQPLYPWLSGKTFNKWFVPDGCALPLSLLPINIADCHDFRRGAFEEMLQFLQDEGIVYTKAEYKAHIKSSNLSTQSNLFEPSIFVICGPTCSGKTTLASFLQATYGYFHLEASDFMYLSYYDKHGFNSSVSISDFAENALKENPSIVSDQIIKNIVKLKHVPFLVTGFRSPKEIESFIEKIGNESRVVTTYVGADQYIRYKRSLIRARSDSQKDIHTFGIKDKQQMDMGLAIIEKIYETQTILNNSTFEQYYSSFESKYNIQLSVISANESKTVPSYFKRSKLQNTIIIALSKADENTFYTTTGIANLINSSISEGNGVKSKNNISRYFNQNFHPYFEISLNESGKTSYRLSQTGQSYATWLKNYS